MMQANTGSIDIHDTEKVGGGTTTTNDLQSSVL